MDNLPRKRFHGSSSKQLGQEKKNRNEGGGEEEKDSLFSPPTPTPSSFFFALLPTFAQGVFEERTTGSEAISLVICLDATKFILPSFFTLTEAICPKF